jgi:hypothetical protein
VRGWASGWAFRSCHMRHEQPELDHRMALLTKCHLRHLGSGSISVSPLNAGFHLNVLKFGSFTVSDNHYWLIQAQFSRLKPILPNRWLDDWRVIGAIYSLIKIRTRLFTTALCAGVEWACSIEYSQRWPPRAQQLTP